MYLFFYCSVFSEDTLLSIFCSFKTFKIFVESFVWFFILQLLLIKHIYIFLIFSQYY